MLTGRLRNLKKHQCALMLLALFVVLAATITYFTSTVKAAAGDYGEMLYPYRLQYEQTAMIKIGLDFGGASPELDCGEALDVIRRIDNIYRGMPKIAYLVGWQYNGHDTGYPSLDKVNNRIKRPDDATALDSLKWLIKEAKKYNTLVSLHMNFRDGYIDDNPLGPYYMENDIFARNIDGTYIKGGFFSGHQSYNISNHRNWYQNTFKNMQIKGLFDILPELKEIGSIHADAWYGGANPYYGITQEQDEKAMLLMTRHVRQQYNCDITTEFDWYRTANMDFVLYHPALWNFGWRNNPNEPDPIKFAPYIYCGGGGWGYDGAITTYGKYFGGSFGMETIISADPVNLPNGIKVFCLHTLPWYYLNTLLRESFDGTTARFSNNVTVTWPYSISHPVYDCGRVIKKGNDFLQDGSNVFIPALWRTNKEIIAYSLNGYSNRTWKLPEDWSNVTAVDIYKITVNGLTLKQKNVSVSNRNLTISLAANEGVSILPAGTDPNSNPVPEPTGTVEFIGKDTTTKGSWKNVYGTQGYVIVGAGESIPSYATVSYINATDKIWSSSTTDERALQKPGAANDRIAAQKYAKLHEIIDVNITDGTTRNISLYLLDWDNQGRWTVVDVIDAKTRKLLNSQNVYNFSNGVYLKYKVSGNVQFRITNIWTKRYKNSSDTGFSGLFFDGNGQVIKPTFSPAGGSYDTEQVVIISCATSGATIRYTTDGSTPTSNSPIYTEPITVSSTAIIRAYATKPGLSDSDIANTAYVIQAAKPTFSPAPQTFNSVQTVSIACATDGATIRYTTDGSTPTSSSPIYTEPITVTGTTTIKAYASKPGLGDSGMVSGDFKIKVSTPTFTPNGGAYDTEQTVSISCATSGATIRYTTDGSNPTPDSPIYTEPITVTGTTTIKAYATKPGWTDSDIGRATYSITEYYSKKVNCGGGAVDGLLADQAYTPGSWGYTGTTYTYATSDTINPDCGYPNAMKSERYSPSTFSYKFDVPNGTYTVKLYFAEIYSTSAGARKFSVDIEGVNKLNEYDIYADAGGHDKGVVKTFSGINVADGVLQIDFKLGSINAPKINIIEIN